MSGIDEAGELAQSVLPVVLRDSILSGEWLVDGQPMERIVSVGQNPFSSRNTSVLMDVATRRGGVVRILAKAGRLEERTDAGDLWGVAQEVRAYAGPLHDLPNFSSPFIGALHDASTDACWLVLRWLDDAHRVAKSPDPQAIELAAAWLGRFHRATSARIRRQGLSGLVDYFDAIPRWAALAQDALVLHARSDVRIRAALDSLESALAPLLQAEPTVVHGDFYPPNVLVHGDVVVPIDWEWCGVGAGEIDLAALTEGWGERAARRCLTRYVEARWGEPADRATERRVEAARLFLALRAIGGHLAPTDPLPALWRDQLVSSCERLATLPDQPTIPTKAIR